MRISLITGANKGIGFEVARQLGGLGGQKVLVGARNEERGRKAAAALRAEGVDAGHVLVDVTDAAGLKRAAERIEREHGRLDALVNNAGIAILDWNLRPGRVPLDMVRRTYETNVVGVIAVTDAMLPLLRRSEAGRIVNVSSRLGSLAVMSDRASPVSRVNLLAYNSSKAALNAVTVAYAKELAETPIKVNSVNPGFCDTDMASDLIAAMGAGRGVRTPAEGARAAVTAATLPDDGPTGSFFGDEGPVPW